MSTTVYTKISNTWYCTFRIAAVTEDFSEKYDVIHRV